MRSYTTALAIAVAPLLLFFSHALPSAAATATVVAQATPTPTPTPNALTFRGKFRSYYFTRQNSSNNPGVQYSNAPGAKYNTNAVNQATWNSAIDLHADYRIGTAGWYAGASYLYANPLDGPCSVAANHAASSPYLCTHQNPPNTNPDDTLPGFALSTLYEAYVAYHAGGLYGKIGDQLFTSPWASPVDTRLKPAAFRGGDVIDTTPQGWTYELADMVQFESRTSSDFSSATLLTSYPSGGNGIPTNIYAPGGLTIATPGFWYGHVGYQTPDARSFVNGAFYAVTDVLNMGWFDAKSYLSEDRWKPYVWMQGGWESNNGREVVGSINSSLFGVQVGANATRDIVVSASYVETPWQSQTITLPAGDSCGANAQLSIKTGTTFPYFLPLNAGQCKANPGGTTTIYDGGWASPYTDNYATNPVFTTAISQGMADRRAPGTSWRLAATYTAVDGRLIFIAGNSWVNYGNPAAPQTTNEFNLDGTFRFSRVYAHRPYHGLQFRYRFANRAYSNTYCGADGSTCLPGFVPGEKYLGGQPLFKYNRAMLEYDF